MKKIKWKPVLMTREDGSSYVMGDDAFNKTSDRSQQILTKILKMPKAKPISFADGYRIVCDHTDTIIEEQGGRACAHWMNQHGFFPEGLTALGYHIEVRTEDFEVIG